MTQHTVVDVLPRDAIQSIDDPTFGPPADDGEGESIVVEREGTARGYPTRILQEHEVVNDEFGGPIAVTWCPLCASGVVYDRRVDGRTLTFGVSGKLADNDLVLYDRETGTEWKQSSGVALSGPLEGAELTAVPAATMAEAAFAERFDGEVLQPPEWGDSAYGVDRFADYATSDGVGPGGDARLRETIDEWDHDFGPKALTLGLAVEGDARGYPRPVVASEGGVVLDELGGTDVVVFATPAGLFGYERDGLAFDPTEDPDQFRADGTTWDAVTGTAADGRRLSRLPARRLFAFTWQDDHGPDAFYGE